MPRSSSWRSTRSLCSTSGSNCRSAPSPACSRWWGLSRGFYTTSQTRSARIWPCPWPPPSGRRRCLFWSSAGLRSSHPSPTFWSCPRSAVSPAWGWRASCSDSYGAASAWALDTLASLPMSWTILISTLCARAPVLGAGDLGRVLFAAVAGVLALPAALAPFRPDRQPSARSAAASVSALSPGLRGRRPRDRRRAVALAFVSILVALLVRRRCLPRRGRRASVRSSCSRAHEAGPRRWR